MVDVHATQALLPLPQGKSQYPSGFPSSSELLWKDRYGNYDQEWDFGGSQTTRRHYDSLQDTSRRPSAKVGDRRGRSHLPYPSPLSLPRGDEDDMTLNAPTPAEFSGEVSGYSEPSTFYGQRANGVSANAIYQHDMSRHQLIASQSVSRVSSKPASPVFQQSNTTSNSGGSIVSYLQLPSTITTSEGSLSEFAAQLTCLFWFEEGETVAEIESTEVFVADAPQLIPEAYPATGFMKWVTTILSTTQVTQNVILLALLFIYRLKKQCPGVKGKLGSEYRLLTVALMLGNKFLDDNTYTNKTWAEVSGISVHEIHVMEVEFLSHMKYNLYTSKEQWDRWHQQLAKFWTCFDRSLRKPKELGRPSPRMALPLPSPSASSHASPHYQPAVSPSSTDFGDAPVLLPPVQNMEYLQHSNARKRSYDNDMAEPPAKRPSVQGRHGSSMSAVYGPGAMHGIYGPGLTLPAPNLPSPAAQQAYGNARATMAFQPSTTFGQNTPPVTMPATVNWLNGLSTPSVAQQQQAQAQQAIYAPIQYAAPQRPSPSRSQSTASSRMAQMSFSEPYPGNVQPSRGSIATTPSCAYPPPSVHHHVTGYPSSSTLPPPSSFFPASSSGAPADYPYNFSAGRPQLIPYPLQTEQLSPAGNVPPSAHTLTPMQLSPSHYLTNRSSPYRPVRNMSTLLVPPPSGAMPQHPAQISQEQMRWQPLGKNVDSRTGRVPYLHREAWPETHQFNQWPSLYTTN